MYEIYCQKKKMKDKGTTLKGYKKPMILKYFKKT